MPSMKCILVSHTHWDREWYRTFQSFRARLVDTIDCVLDLIAADPGFHFLLDGQTIVVEDYLEIRPQRRAELAAACRAGRIAIGPWYVQPDSLLPSGEAHVRNLLEGRRVGSEIGPVSTVAYCPDSFGHPAQLPQLFSGFGLSPFVYWRGNGNEVDELPAEYQWEAPDGSTVLAHVLSEGYFAACGLPGNIDAAARYLADVGAQLGQRTTNACVLLMNGFDHAAPQAHTAAVAEALAARSGWTVQRGLLENFARELAAEAPRFRGPLLGGRLANLLPGVWSARLPLKLRNRRAETALESWAEPWCALGATLGLADERPALRHAWRSLLQNQAHDSICGCSIDRVHAQMLARYETAEELARETTTRVLERLAGVSPARRTPWGELEIAVFNPSPHPRTDVVAFALDPFTFLGFPGETEREMAVHPWLLPATVGGGFTVDGVPARVIADADPSRVRVFPTVTPCTLQFIAADIPAFGYRRFRVASTPPADERHDSGTAITADDLTVTAAADGTLTLAAGESVYAGLFGVEDVGDRGDTYDFDPVAGDPPVCDGVNITRRIASNGIQHLLVERQLRFPVTLDETREHRSSDLVASSLTIEARLAPGVRRLDVHVRLDNRARDHRLRLLFPTGGSPASCYAATTFDVSQPAASPPTAHNWVHSPPATFPHHGFVSANGLTVVAPGLPEAEVTRDGVIAITLLRAVGWLAQWDLHTRPQPAGPGIPTPEAQCQGTLEATLAVLVGLDPRAARDAEIGLRAVVAGADAPLAANHALLSVSPREIVVSALKPAEAGPGFIVRVLNPTDMLHTAEMTFGCLVKHAVPVGPDETPLGGPLPLRANAVSLDVPPHALRSVWIT
jgi:mannosylglycerate hydrolase